MPCSLVVTVVSVTQSAAAGFLDVVGSFVSGETFQVVVSYATTACELQRRIRTDRGLAGNVPVHLVLPSGGLLESMDIIQPGL